MQQAHRAGCCQLRRSFCERLRRPAWPPRRLLLPPPVRAVGNLSRLPFRELPPLWKLPSLLLLLLAELAGAAQLLRGRALLQGAARAGW